MLTEAVSLSELQEAWQKHRKEIRIWLKELVEIIPSTTKITQCDPEYKENWVVETADPEQWHSFQDRLDLHLQKFPSFLSEGSSTEESSFGVLLQRLITDLPQQAICGRLLDNEPIPMKGCDITDCAKCKVRDKVAQFIALEALIPTTEKKETKT